MLWRREYIVGDLKTA